MPLRPQANALSQPPTRVTTYQASDTHQPPDTPQHAGPGQTPIARTTPPTKELTMRINPSDVLFLILSAFTLLAAALVLGGLAAHPFSG
nr:MAG TPA: hypothetical protein [Caudoviricetes sp.]